ncbi:DUF3592 domain-containing protein [Halorientalis pallida]|uniref:DUF3592 domain-containing protein n=1 Tax=Halorientalis pallida TaxID=2479928 RepID=UPI003C6F0CF4
MSLTLSVGDRDLEFSRGLLVAAVFWAAVAGYGGYTYAEQSRTIANSQPVTATVTNTSLHEVEYDQGQDKWEPGVTFEYRYEGTNYTSTNLFPGFAQDYADRAKARAVLDPYTVGASTTAYVPPESPDEAFLERRTTETPLLFLGIGGFALLWILLSAATANLTPGRGTDLRSPDAADAPARPGPVLGIDHDRLQGLLKRLLAGLAGLGALSVLAGVGAFLAVKGRVFGPPVSIQADLLGPVGFPFLVLFVSWVGLVASLLCYGWWSYREYRYLRERIVGARPPSPFRHPLVLFAIVTADGDDLDQYGNRIRVTAATVLTAAILSVPVLRLLGVV